jgi:hypothetical protein
MAEAVHQFGSIYLGLRGGVVSRKAGQVKGKQKCWDEYSFCGGVWASQAQGQLRLGASGLTWRRTSGGKPIEIKKDGGAFQKLQPFSRRSRPSPAAR